MDAISQVPDPGQSQDTRIAALLSGKKTIAVVGLSADETKPSYRVARYMQSQGYRIIPVNPSITEALGEKAYGSVAQIPERVDIVDIFRRPEAVPEVVLDAIAAKAGAVWMQEGVVHEEAAKKAAEAGLEVVMDRCIMKEHIRQNGH